MSSSPRITWVNFLHIYQPPWQDNGTIEQIASQSYEYLLMLLERYRQFGLTLNITGNLLERLEELRPDIIKELQKVVARSQVELTATAKFHSFLPLLPLQEVERQIMLNKQTLRRYFPKVKIEGFYFPEMAFTPEIAAIVKKHGYKWIILDEIALNEEMRTDTLYIHKTSGLRVVFRGRSLSKKYPPEVIYKLIAKRFKNQTLISGHDGETYGYYHEDWQGHIEKVLQNSIVESITVGKYLAGLKKAKKVTLRASTWETRSIDLDNKNPWLLWNDPKNIIHSDLWKLTYLAIDLVRKNFQDANWKWARNRLDRALSSCTFWWSTGKKPSPFAEKSWNPEIIDNGAEELIKVVRTFAKLRKSTRIAAENLYIDIKKNTWLTHWRKFHKHG